MRKIKKLVVGNWKMNPESVSEAKKIASEVKRGMRKVSRTNVVMCPPFVYLSSISGMTSNSLFLGAQDAFYETLGSYTGEVSYSQLHQFKVGFVILGHSERRKKGETDEIVNKKVLSVMNNGMTAILCVGEEKRDHNGEYLEYVKKQLEMCLKNAPKKLADHLVIAYEPVWAIGAKEAMNPRDAHEMAIFIRKILRDMFGAFENGIRILYGGAVNEFNSKDIVRDNFINGFLVGRESLKPKNFLEIIKIVDQI